MAGFSESQDQHLIRANLWSNMIKEVLLDELYATKYIHMLTDFPDGTTLNIPSIGLAEVHDYVEGEAIRYTAMDKLDKSQCSSKTKLYAGNPLEPWSLIWNSIKDWAISRKGKDVSDTDRSRDGLVCRYA